MGTAPAAPSTVTTALRDERSMAASTIFQPLMALTNSVHWRRAANISKKGIFLDMGYTLLK